MTAIVYGYRKKISSVRKTFQRLIANIVYNSKNHNEGDLSFLDEPWVAEFDALLGEQTAFNKQQFIKSRGRRGRRRGA